MHLSYFPNKAKANKSTDAVTPEPQYKVKSLSKLTPCFSNSFLNSSFDFKVKSSVNKFLKKTFKAPGICPTFLLGLGSGTSPLYLGLGLASIKFSLVFF